MAVGSMDTVVKTRLRHRYASVDGVRIHWVETESCGGSTRPPLVLLHGLNDCYRTWRRIAPLVGRNRRVLMPDLPGHGLSERPDASYELHWYARLMGKWLDAAGIETCDVAGHSFGGGVGQTMLLECPERILRLGLIASGGLGREVAWLLRLASVPRLVERFGQPLMGPCTKVALRAIGNLMGRDDIERLTSMNSQRGSARAFARTVRDVIDWRGQRRSFFHRAHDIAELPPIALFWGDRDSIIPVAHAKAMCNSVDGIRTTIFSRCGHYPHHEQTEALATALLEFLDDPHAPRARLRLAAQPARRTTRPLPFPLLQRV